MKQEKETATINEVEETAELNIPKECLEAQPKTKERFHSF